MRKILNIREWLHNKHNEEIVKRAQARLEIKKAALMVNPKTGGIIFRDFIPAHNIKMSFRINVGR